MNTDFKEITLSKSDLEAALQVLDSGCDGEVTLVFGRGRLAGPQIEKTLSQSAFVIEPASLRCMYGCKNELDVHNAILSGKGVIKAPEDC
ncbi:MAG: hypothetical protein WBF53_05205 [Litorimonas sp.]